MALNPFDYATPEDRPGSEYTFYAADPDEFYPATLAHVGALVEAGKRPLPNPRYNDDGELIAVDQNPLQPLYDRARVLPRSVWSEVLDLPFGDPVRVEALEVARLWFTELLQQAVNGPLGLHILKREHWRL